MSMKEYNLVYECKIPECEGGIIKTIHLGIEGLHLLKQGRHSINCPHCEELEKMPEVELQQ